MPPRQDHFITDEEKRDAIRRMCLADDTFFCAICKLFPEVVQFILRTILAMPDLIVVEVKTQSDERSLINRSVLLDVVARDAAGRTLNVEVQNANAGAAPERARFHSAVLDSAGLQKNRPFTDLPETYVIFITRGDPLGKGLQLCHVERVIIETGDVFGDREHIIYASMKYIDETPLGHMLHDFLCENPKDMKCPQLAEKVDYLKNDDKGVSNMCEIMQELNKLAVERSKALHRWETQRENVQNMLKDGVTKEKIMRYLRLTEEEFDELSRPLAS